MFRWMHHYYTNILDKPSVLFVLNIWTYINIRYFKFKYLRNIYIFISNLDTIKIKHINVLYRDWTFENFFTNTLNYVILLILLLFLI